MQPRFLAVLALGTLFGCSTGQLGAQGKVRFSQVVSFVETSDFGAPIVTGSGMLVQLEYPAHVVETVNPGLTLLVADGKSDSPSSHAEVLPLGFGQYAITLAQSGSYTLVANQGGSSFDTLSVSAASAAAIRFHATADVAVVGASQSGSPGAVCGSAAQVALSSLVLSPNSAITLHVVPVDGNGSAMLGLLQLTATATGPVSLEGDFIGQGLEPNSITVTANGTLGATATIDVTDAVSGKSVSLTLPTQTALATCSG